MTTRSNVPLTSALHSRVDVLGFCAAVRDHAASSGLDTRRAGELALVVAELGTNVVLHGGGGELAVTLSHAGWTVHATDAGPGFTAAVLEDAGRSDHLGAHGVREPGDGGRSFGSGLAAVRRLSDSLTLHNEPRGARVTAQRHLTSHARQGAVS